MVCRHGNEQFREPLRSLVESVGLAKENVPSEFGLQLANLGHLYVQIEFD